MVEQVLWETITRQTEKKNVWEEPAQIYQEKIAPDQLDCLLQLDDLLCE